MLRLYDGVFDSDTSCDCAAALECLEVAKQHDDFGLLYPHYQTLKNALLAKRKDGQLTKSPENVSKPDTTNADESRLVKALQPFANYACDPIEGPCACNNCEARDAIAEHEASHAGKGE